VQTYTTDIAGCAAGSDTIRIITCLRGGRIVDLDHHSRYGNMPPVRGKPDVAGPRDRHVRAVACLDKLRKFRPVRQTA